MPYIFLIAAFVCNASASILLKLAALKSFSFAALFRGEWTWATLYAGSAVALFGLNLIFYLLALEKFPLSIAYPIMIGMTFLITITASVFLGEKITLIHALGMALILAGVFTIVRFTAP